MNEIFKNGTINRITGLSGVGKTTLGIQLIDCMSDYHSNIIIYDLDRNITSDRLKMLNAKKFTDNHTTKVLNDINLTHLGNIIDNTMSNEKTFILIDSYNMLKGIYKDRTNIILNQLIEYIKNTNIIIVITEHDITHPETEHIQYEQVQYDSEITLSNDGRYSRDLLLFTQEEQTSSFYKISINDDGLFYFDSIE